MSLQEVLHSSSLAETVFKALAMRERFRQVTDLRRLYNDVDKLTHGAATPEEFNRVVQNMEKAGLGKFVAGRKNNPDRFKWADKTIAKSVKEGKLEEPILEIEAPKVISPPQEISKQPAVTYINVRIPLSIPLDSLQAFLSNLKA